MAIAFRAATNVQTATGNKPTGTALNDILLASIIDEGNHTLTPPSGWTQLDNVLISSTIRAASFWKLAGGSEPSTYGWTISGQTYTEIDIAAFSGCDTSTPINAHNIATDPSSPTTAVPNVTTTVANAMLWVGVNEWFGHDWSSGGPSGYTVDSGETLSAAWDMASFHRAVTTATTYGGEIPGWNNGNGGNFKSIICVALAPAGAAAPVGITPDIYRSVARAVITPPKPKMYAFRWPEVYAPPPSGAITAQAGLGIGVNAPAVTVQTAYAITCQAGVGIGVNAPNVTVQTAQAVTAAAGLGIGVNAPTTTLQTAQAITAQAGVGIGVIKNIDATTAYSMALVAGLGIGIIKNIDVNTGGQIVAQAGLGIGVNPPNVLMGVAYAITANPGLGIGIAGNIAVKTAQAISATPGVGIGVAGALTVQTAYTMGFQTGLGIGVAQNATLADASNSNAPRPRATVRAGGVSSTAMSGAPRASVSANKPKGTVT